MRFVMVATIFSAISTSVFAQQGTCKLLAVEKKLIGAPLSTFMEKCGDDAQKTCEQLAWARRLEEPGRTLFFNNCVKTFIG